MDKEALYLVIFMIVLTMGVIGGVLEMKRGYKEAKNKRK